MATCLSCDDDLPNSSSSPKLHLITYLCPDFPLELFQTYQHYLEEVLSCESYLIVESRWGAPPAGKKDPFTANEVDIGFMCSTGYLRMLDEWNLSVELLPVGPVHDHPKSECRNATCFLDVVVRKEKAELYKELADLRGHRWAALDKESLCGKPTVLSEVKKIGYNASFFGNIVSSGSNVESIGMVLNNVVDAAAIDSNVLQLWMSEHHEQAAELHVMCSWGPWPTQPIVVNSRLPEKKKLQITDALLNVANNKEYTKRFAKYGVLGFQSTNDAMYECVREVLDLTKNQTLYPTYY